MTRRDFCHECHELVADLDVCCDECSNSYCSDCTKGYDPLSRFCLLQAQSHKYHYTHFTLGELKQLGQDVAFLVTREYNIPEIAQILSEYKETDDDTTRLTLPHQESFQMILSDLQDAMDEEAAADEENAFTFVCIHCRYPPF